MELQNISNRLIYGTMGLGGGWHKSAVDRQAIREAEEAIEAALDIGITFYDHANIYQNGKSEEVFGHYLNANPRVRENMIIQSKVGIILPGDNNFTQYNFSYNHIMDEVKGSLNRLQTDYLDILLLHRPDPLMDRKEMKRAMDELFHCGMIRAIGVSNMSYHQIELLEDYIERPVIANQLEMSLHKLDWVNSGVVFNHSDYKDLDVSVGTVEYCMRKKISIQAWGSLAQGMFTGKKVDGKQPENIIKTKELVNQLAEEKGSSPEGIVLSWLMRHPANISPIIGTKNPDRIRATKDAIRDDVSLTREEWFQLLTASRGQLLP